MKRIAITPMQGGSYVAAAVIQICEIPDASAVSSDGNEAVQQKISTVFSEILEATSIGAANQDTVIELLYIALPVHGQTYAAQVQPYLVLRRFGASEGELTARLSGTADNCIESLRSVSYRAEIMDADGAAFQAALQQISEASVFTIEKSLRSAYLPSQNSYACFTDTLPFRKYHNYSRVIEALSNHPRSALCIQLIPASFSAEERMFIQQMSYMMNMSVPGMQHIPAPRELTEYYEGLVSGSDRVNYLFNIITMGDPAGAMDIAGKMKTALQGDGTLELTLVNRSGWGLSYARSFAFFPWNALSQTITNAPNAAMIPPLFQRMLHMLSFSEAACVLHLPYSDGHITGIAVNHVQRIRETFAGKVLHEDNIQIGRLRGASESSAMFGAPLKEFTRHTLLVGIPGTGKTTFAVNLLLQFYKRGIPFLAIEPTKAEYRAMIDAIPDLQVFTPGKNGVVPFIINPFLPPEGITLETFKPSLLSAFKAAFSMPSPLDILFARAMDACYVAYGWRNYSKVGDEGVRPFGLQEFVIKFREIIKNSNYSAESKGNMESAGVFRLLNLVIQNGNIYDTIHSVPLQDLLRRPTIIELNAIDNQEQKALIMALLLIQIILYTKNLQAGDGKLKNILLIDEAHVLLGNMASSHAEGAAEAGASTVRALQNMIVEIRSYGTGIIIADQSPRKVTREIVGNTGIKVMFQLLEAEDRQMIATSSNMSDTDEKQLGTLGTGEAYAFYRGLSAPQRVQTEDIRAREGIRLSVSDDEIHRRMHYWDDRSDLLKPYLECSYAGPCSRCNFHIRDDARFYVEQMFLRDKALLPDKPALLKMILGMPQKLRPLCPDMPQDAFRQLLHCTRIKYIRKAALETKAILSENEIRRVLEACQGESLS